MHTNIPYTNIHTHLRNCNKWILDPEVIINNNTEQEQTSQVPFSSLSSSPSSHHKPHPLPLSQICDQQHPDQAGSWLASNHDLEQQDSAKPELMDEKEGATQDKEHMFDKVVTPSDVGKLNRLVIPKQHAEKYFPLESSTNDKGLLLNFEDRIGKAWRFRYSYWNSSQSYVMTKGWSRFVKEKKLEAGDIVSFQRGLGEAAKYRLYIDWRRRPDRPDRNHPQRHLSSTPWSPLLMRPPAARDHFQLSNPNPYRNMCYSSGVEGGSSHNYSNVVGSSTSGTVVYLRSTTATVPLQQQVGMGVVQWQQGASGGVIEPLVFESVPVVQGKAAAKRLRLFGVNMDCPIFDSDECDKISEVTAFPSPPPPPPPYHHYHHDSPQLSSPFHHNHPLQLRLYNGMPVPSACLPRNSYTKGSHPCP